MQCRFCVCSAVWLISKVCVVLANGRCLLCWLDQDGVLKQGH
jgi:hypothetical protein